jgi:deazaflavin-dependent oxidoreductase (nitroreductase family)
LKLGWLMGERMLLLNHIGRKSGLVRQAVLEVVLHDQVTDAYIVAAAFGKKTHWYQNLLKQPNVSIRVGRRKLDVSAEQFAKEAGAEALLAFVKEHPWEARFVNLLGYRVDGTDEDWRALGEQMIFVALRPRGD